MVTNLFYLLIISRVKNQVVDTQKDQDAVKAPIELFQNILKMIQLFMQKEQNQILCDRNSTHSLLIRVLQNPRRKRKKLL